MEKLQILCDGGLGNRLNSLIGGILTAKKLNLDIHVSWPLNNWCRACFTDLFDFSFKTFDNNDIHQVFEDNKNNYYAIHSNQINYPIPPQRKINPHNYNFSKSALYYCNLIPSSFSQKQVIEELNSFLIKPSILNRVNLFCSKNNINDQTKGIHLRKTDFPGSLKDSQIFSHIMQNSNDNFFICSDDKETELSFSKLSNVSTHSKNFYVSKLVEGNWNHNHKDEQGRKAFCNMDRSKHSVIDGFIDMLILSRTTPTIGENGSTYFRYSLMYNKIKYKNHELD